MAFDLKTHGLLIKALGLENLEAEDQQKRIEESGAIIYQMVLLRAMEEMTDEQVNDFEKLLETTPEPDKIFEFFHQTISNFDTMIEEEAHTFIEDSNKIMN